VLESKITRSTNLAGDGYSYAKEVEDMTMLGNYSSTDIDNSILFQLSSNNITPKSSSYRLGLGATSTSSRLVVQGNTSGLVDDPLFEVKNNAGQTVFAVYNEGVRIWVDDNAQKATGNRGGFAVGGFSSSKAETDEYLRVTPDSVRVYIDADNAKATGNRGGFAVGGFSSSKTDPVDLMRLTKQNYFIGHSAGLKTTGVGNIFLGYESGKVNVGGTFNTFLGYWTGWSNIGGDYNIFIGTMAGLYNTEGNNNTFVGIGAGAWNTAGNMNVMIGNNAGQNNDIGSDNVFIGKSAGQQNDDGSDNVFIGKTSGNKNVGGDWNTFVGSETGVENTSGFYNTFIGFQAGHENTTAGYNTMVGYHAGYFSSTGANQAFLGYKAGYENTGNNNTFIGSEAGYLSGAGIENVYIGLGAGRECTGNNNVFIGRGAGMSETGNHQLIIENSVSWNNDYETLALVYGDFANDWLRVNGNFRVNGTTLQIEQNPGSDATPAYYAYQGSGIGSTSKQYAFAINDALWVTQKAWFDNYVYALAFSTTSDKRFKKDIISIDSPLNKVMQINGVYFNWKVDEYPEKNFSPDRNIGFIAQEIETILPEVVQTDETGYKTVNYANITALLVEAIKEQQKQIEELKASNLSKENTINELKTEIEKINQLQIQLDKVNEILNISTSNTK